MVVYYQLVFRNNLIADRLSVINSPTSELEGNDEYVHDKLLVEVLFFLFVDEKHSLEENK